MVGKVMRLSHDVLWWSKEARMESGELGKGQIAAGFY